MSRIRDLWHNRDKTKTGRYGQGLRWQAIWTDGRGGEAKKSHRTKDAAEQWLIDQENKSLRGLTKDSGRVLVRELQDEWIASQVQWSPRFLHETTKTWEKHIIPRFGDMLLENIVRADLREWVFDMNQTLSPATVKLYFGRFTSFLEWCVEEKLIASNPAKGVELPRLRKRQTLYLTVEEYRTLRQHMHPNFQDSMDVAVTTGLRPGELWELRAGDIDVERRRLNVSRSASEVKGALVVGETKTYQDRSVPITQSVADMLAKRVQSKARSSLIFTTTGNQVRQTTFNRRYWKPAVEAAGLPQGLRFYDLRHTAASWAIRSGASVKAVQRMLGHATASITLDVYSHLFDDELDSVADRIGDMFDGKTATVDRDAA